MDIQHGFRESKSTQSASQSFIEYIQEAMDKSFYVAGICLDLTKAYDVLNHYILLDKLNCYGIRGTTNQWFKSYLSHHTQFVQLLQADNINNSQKAYVSSNRTIKQGVPQGSILGSLLFLLYINDLPLHVEDVKIVLSADNTNILVTDKNLDALQLKLRRAMEQLEIWFQKNNLSINMEKTTVMFFS
jgi:hypothetical protein